MIGLAAPKEPVLMSLNTVLQRVSSHQTLEALQKLDGVGTLAAHYLYVNATSRLQVVRIENVPDWHFERVVFPGQRLLIEVKPDAVLDVYTGTMATAMLEERIACETLKSAWL